MTTIMYQVFDAATDETIGTITGGQLRQAAGAGRNTPVFNATLVTEFNANKERIGEPERLRQIICN